MPGPASQRNALRTNTRSDWVTLPADGFRGTVPEWPLPGGEPDHWEYLWRLPQAAAWHGKGLDLVVARYAALLAVIEQVEVKAAILGEVRQIEDRLGLSPMSMKRLQWVVEEVAERPKPADVVRLDDYRDL